MADQNQKPKRRGTEGPPRDSEDRDLDNSLSARNPTDLGFFSDPTIYEPGEVTEADKETHREHGNESGRRSRGNRRPDDEIKDEIGSLLAWQKTIDAKGIQVDVKDGIVTLSGNVGSQYDKQVAEDLTGNVLGIREVNNLLTIDRQE